MMGRVLPTAIGVALAYWIVAADAAPTVAGWQRVATIDSPALRELSGLAPSHRQPARWWAVNDSGNAPQLHAFDAAGRGLGAVTIGPTSGFDWEALAAFDWRGEAWLAVGDIGDNLGLRREVSVLLLPEPEPQLARTTARELRFRYPDGARDAEALMVDAAAGQILIAEKARGAAALYALDLEGPLRQVARRLADIPQAWPASDDFPVLHRRAISDMALSRDGTRWALLDERQVLMFERRPSESWQEVLRRRPQVWPLPRDRRLYEALAFDEAGALWIAPEGSAPPLSRLLVTPP